MPEDATETLETETLPARSDADQGDPQNPVVWPRDLNVDGTRAPDWGADPSEVVGD